MNRDRHAPVCQPKTHRLVNIAVEVAGRAALHCLGMASTGNNDGSGAPGQTERGPAMRGAPLGSVAIGLATGVLGALALLTIGFAPVIVIPVAWLLTVCAGGLHASLRGASWTEHRIIASIIAVGSLVLLVDLSIHGPSRFAGEQDVESGRPATIGVLGYLLTLDERGEVAVELGPEPSVAPNTPYISIPGIPGQSEGTHATNSPVRVGVACVGEQCNIQLTPTGIRRDFIVGMRAAGGDDWKMAGAVDIPSTGYALRLRERADLGGPLGTQVLVEGEAFLERVIPITVDASSVRFGDCEIPRGPEPIYLPALEIRFIDTTHGCRLLPLTDEAHLHGRWLSRARDGSIAIPAHSLFEVSEAHVRWYPLEDHNLASSILAQDGTEVVPTPPQLEVARGDDFELALFRREFREIRLSEAVSEACAQAWRPLGEDWLHPRPTGCRQLLGTLHEQGFVAKVADREPMFEIRADRRDRRWGHQLFLDISPESWLTDPDEPRRHVLLSGRWPQGTTYSGSNTVEAYLDLPLRLYGTTPYRAVITFETREDDGVTLWIADALRRGEVQVDSAVLTLGPPDAQALITYERAPHPWRVARGVLWPTLLLSIALTLLSFSWLTGARIAATASRVAAFGSCVAVVVAHGLLQKALVAYTLVVHAPHDWKAFDQLLSSALILPMTIAFAGALALMGSGATAARGTSHGRRRLWVALALALFAVVLARSVGSVLGREAALGLRFVSLTPILAALFWMCAMAARSFAPRRGMTDGLTMALGAGLVLSWWTDKGAMLLLAIPVSMGIIPLLWGHPVIGRAYAWICAFAYVLILMFPQAFIQIWSGSENLLIPRLSVAQSTVCGDTDDEDIATLITAHCRTEGSPLSPLDTLDQAGVLDASASVSTRRHPLRGLDWMEDGAQYSECDAVDRFATRDAMEVGFFRAVAEHYRGSEPRYLRNDLLPFSPGVTNALLNDYVGVVAYLPQMPRGTLSAMALMISMLFLLVLAHGRPWSSLPGSAGVGAAALLLGAAVLTTAANLDGFPNFAQSVPLLALRSGSALMLDALALFTMVLGFALHTHPESEP